MPWSQIESWKHGLVHCWAHTQYVNTRPKRRETHCTHLLCFGGFVLTASMFYLPRPFFPGCLHDSSETRRDSDSKWCFEKLYQTHVDKVGRTVVQWLALLPHSKRVASFIPLSVKSACSSCVYVGSLQVLQDCHTAWTHAREMNWKL